MTSLRSRSFAVALFLVTNIFLAGIAAAQDVITVGTATADDGPTVDIPVYLRDVSGTPLGVDHPAPARIQAFSIRVTYPASAVSSVTFSRAGITAGLTPVFETAPASSGAISLLASFQQSTNPIPFTSNAPAPGDLIAHLVFTLSSSVTPGSDIALTLDAATTQLTDDGGTAATKETAGNGHLALVDGSIHIPVPSLTLSPPTQSIQAGGNGLLSLNTGTRLVAGTTATLSSSNPSVASVPSSVNLAAGSSSTGFTVSALSPGTTTITATLPQSAGGATATAQITVTEAPNCPAPVAPSISGPATALSGSTYTITWAAVANATEYVIDESTDASFNPSTSRTVNTTSASYSHATGGVRYYYRVRARNHATPCDEISPASNAASVLIMTVVLPVTRYLPVVGSAAGNQGSFFRTALQLYNPKTSAISGKIVFHPQAVSGTASDPSLAYSIPAGKTLSYADLLPAMGISGGLGTVDLIGDTGSSLPVTVARIFNDGGAAGTSGLSLDSMPAADALKQGDTGALLAPTDFQKFRFNIGVRTLDQGASLNVTVRDRDGVVVKTLTKSYPATYFTQTSASDFLEGFTFTGGEVVSIEVTNGSIFVYGATTDNVTNDPSVQFAKRIE